MVDSKRYEAGLMFTRTPSSTELLSHVMGDEYEEENAHSSLLKHTPDKAGTIPLFAWSLLGASLLAVSSAAVVFASVPDVPTFTLAAWRLQLTALLLTPAAIYQYRQLTTDDKRRLLKDSLLVLASGGFLALHFACWVWSIHHTSLTHALLYGSTAPVLIAVGTLMIRKPISTGEILGTVLGLVGIVLLIRANKVDQQVTLAGDFAGFLTAVFFCGYIVIGAHLRRWLPIFLYATPVTGFAALLLSMAAFSFEQGQWFGSGGEAAQRRHQGVFGWLMDKSYLPKILYLAAVPGIIGHTGFNAVLKWMPPLLVTLALTAEPVIGTFMGWAVHLVHVPGVWTYSGGAVLLLSTAIVVIAGDRREQAAAAAHVQQTANESPKMSSDFATDCLDSARDVELAEQRSLST